MICWSWSRVKPFKPQSMHTTRELQPCNSLSSSHPALVKRLSTFCVTCQKICHTRDREWDVHRSSRREEHSLCPWFPTGRRFDVFHSVGRRRRWAIRCSFSPNTFGIFSRWWETPDTSYPTPCLIFIDWKWERNASSWSTLSLNGSPCGGT